MALFITNGNTNRSTHNSTDVMFAQMMIPHHRGALSMVRAFDTGASLEIQKLNRDIVTAQGQEITLLKRIASSR